MADVLPGYTWDTTSNRYRSQTTGRYVARRDIVNLLETQVNAGEALLSELTTAMHEGRIDASVFAEQMRTNLRRMHLQNSALGAGGWDRSTKSPQAMGRVGGVLRVDYQHLEQFTRQLQNGELTLAQALSRTRLYVGNARTQFFYADRLVKVPTEGDKMTVERRILGAAEHCDDCLDYYGRGWSRLGSLPIPGTESVCLTNCRCRLEYRDIPIAEVDEWIGTKRSG